MKYISQLMTEYRGGFQRDNRFLCQIYVPSKMLSDIMTGNLLLEIVDVLFPNLGRRIDPNFSVPQVQNWLGRGLMCETARLPDRSFETSDLYHYGFTEQVPVSSAHSTFDVVFRMPLVGGDNALPRFFAYWQHYIQNSSKGLGSSFDFRFPSDYYGDIYLSMYDMKNNPTITYHFEKAYPGTIGTNEMSWDSENKLLTLPVSFNYATWKVVPYTPPPLITIEL